MKKIKLLALLITFIVTCIVFAGCKDKDTTDRNSDSNSSKISSTSVTSKTDDVDDKKSNTSSIASKTEKTSFDRNEDLKVSMADYGTVDIASLPQLRKFADKNINILARSSLSAITTKDNDTVTELKDKQSIIDTMSLYNDVDKIKTFDINMEKNKCVFKYDTGFDTLIISSKDFMSDYMLSTDQKPTYDATTDTMLKTLN